MKKIEIDSKDSFNKVVLLTGAKIIGIIFSLVIPMYLGHKLSIETYGTYKQIMLFFWFSQVALSLGVDDSAYFFIRKDHSSFPLYCFNALVFNLFTTSMLWLFLSIYAVEVAHLLKNPELAQYLSLLGFLIFSTVSSMQIEGILISGLNRFNERLYLEMGTELLKSIAIFSGFYFYSSLKLVLVFLSVVMTLRLLMTIYVIDRYKNILGLSYIEAPKYFFKQLGYGIPLGISHILQNILNIENFFISSFFSLAQFTYYSVGCFENPLINAARTSIFILANIDIVDSVNNNDYPKALEVFRGMSRKLFLIIIPFVCYMILFAHEIIVFIFSNKYLPSVPFFMAFNFFLIVGALNPEPLFKATSKTSLNLKIKLMGMVVGVLLLVFGAYLGGAMYALIGKILGVFITNVTGLIVGARLIRSHFFNLFQWREVGKIFMVSISLSLFLRVLFLKINLLPFYVLAISFSFYFILHFFFSWKFKIIRDDEIYYLQMIYRKLVIKGVKAYSNV